MNARERRTIEFLAYGIYLAEGQPEGRDLQHWLEAEEQFEAEYQAEVEGCFEPNIFGDKAVGNLGSLDLLVRG